MQGLQGALWLYKSTYFCNLARKTALEWIALYARSKF